MKKDKPITQQILMDDDETNIIEEKPLQRGAVKVANKKKEETQLHSPKHNIIDLPSKGRFGYPAQVEYRDIMVEDEEILATATNDTFSRTFNSVLKGVLNDCEFYEQLTEQDRDYIVLWVWANNYGIEKKIEYTCSKCETQNVHTVDLTQINDKPINEKLPMPYLMETKYGGNIEIHFLTVEDELFIEKYANDHPKESRLLMRLGKQIHLEIEPISFAAKLDWIRKNISSRERKVIEAYFDKAQYGYETEIEYKCVNKECGEVTRGELPFQVTDILFPTVHTDFEEYL